MRYRPKSIVVMGVSGSGKSLIGSRLAKVLNASFLEGDHFHPAENIERMRAGIPLNDEDRVKWLDAIGAELQVNSRNGAAAVAACSALKRSYRDRLRAFVPHVLFMFLDVDRETAELRVAARLDHFMPASLVTSQFEALERPDAD